MSDWIKFGVCQNNFCLSESKMFMLLTVILWIIICVPGNIITSILAYKHWSAISLLPEGYDPFSQITNNSNENIIGTVILNTDSHAEEQMDYATPVCTNETIFNHTLKCYECLKDYEHFRESSRYWLEGILIFVAGIVGLICNLMAILILRLCSGNKNFNLLLICLAIVDIFLITELLLERVCVYHLNEPPWFERMYPFFWHPLKGMLLSATMFTVVAVSAERYRAVCYPLTRHHSSWRYMAIVISAAIMSKIPRFFHFRIINENGISTYGTTRLMEDPSYIWFTAYWDDLFITGLLPFSILIYLNARIYLKLRDSRRLDDCRHQGGATSCQKKSTHAETLGQIQLQELGLSNGSRAKHVSGENITQHAVVKSQRSEPILSIHQMKRNEKHFQSLPDKMKAFFGNSKNSIPKRLSFPFNASNDGFKKKRISTEKTTIILISIVVHFLFAHSYRLTIKFYEALMPQSSTEASFEQCFSLGRHHVPVAFYLFFHLNQFFIILSSSVNFIIYCVVAEPFRAQALDFYKSFFKLRETSPLPV